MLLYSHFSFFTSFEFKVCLHNLFSLCLCVSTPSANEQHSSQRFANSSSARPTMAVAVVVVLVLVLVVVVVVVV